MRIKQKSVKDIRELLVEEPTVISSNQSVRDLLKTFFKDQRTRHVYVINDAGAIIGTIRLNDLIIFIMPYLQNVDNAMFNKFISQFTCKKVSDFMTEPFIALKEDTSVIDMLSIMIKNRVEELPVIDDNKKIIGEINSVGFIKYLSNNEHLAKASATIQN